MKYCDCGRRASILAHFADDDVLIIEKERFICHRELVEWIPEIQKGNMVVTRLEAIK